MESLLIIDKVPGPTSFDVVRAVRRHIPREKVGHTGSLDPFASGVLILLVGRATKLSHVLLNADKTYHAVVDLGTDTDTMDRTGTVVRKAAVPSLTETDVRAVLKGFEGTWHQTPPMYSAKKVQGVRLYELARQNIHVNRQPIPVELTRVELKEFRPPVIEFEVHCSKGTYVRSLAQEIGERLGTAAHLSELRRLSCGVFPLAESITVEAFAQNPKQELEKGYQHFLKLLRTELLRPGKRPDEKELASKARLLPSHGLPSSGEGGRTLVAKKGIESSREVRH